MAIDNDFTDALDKIEQVISPLSLEEEAVVNGQSLCEKYQGVKQYLDFILPIIDKVPVWGKKVASTIRFLMSIADSACPTANVWGIVANGGGN